MSVGLTAQDIKDAIRTMRPNEDVRVTDEEGTIYHIRAPDGIGNGMYVSVGRFRSYCTDVQVWDDSILKFRNEDMLVGVLRGIGDMSLAIVPTED